MYYNSYMGIKTGHWLRLLRQIISHRLGLNFAGFAVGCFFFCTSLTPSLLPRPWLYQGLIGGIAFILGYGVGLGASWLGRKIFRREPSAKTKDLAWLLLAVTAPVAIGIYLVKSFGWQNNIRQLIGEQPTTARNYWGVLAVSFLLGARRWPCGALAGGCRYVRAESHGFSVVVDGLNLQ